MLAAGKITADEAEQLLTRVEAGPPVPVDNGAKQKGKLRWLHIKVPLGILRAGMKLAAVLPPEAEAKLNEKGIDLSRLNELKGDELDEVLRELNVDVDSSNGDTVKIFCD